MSDQPKDSIPRKSDTYPDSAATKVLDQYSFRYKHSEGQESTNPLVKRLFGDLAVLCENIIDADRKYREEWQSQGRKLTPEFIRETSRALLYTLSQQKEAIQKNLDLNTLTFNWPGAGVMARIPAKELLEQETKLLERELRNAYERDGAMTSLPVTTAHFLTENRQAQSSFVENSPKTVHVDSRPTAQRRGYRAEVRAWMEQNNISSVSKAARRLGTSESTLKSIMSAQGKLRCSEETLQTILSKIKAKPKT